MATKKRLIVCLDGTWNTPDEGDNPTNVVKIMRAIRPTGNDEVHQIVFYDKGVGTGGPIDTIRGGVFGKGVDDNVQDGYRFLVNNYVRGDELYLFGFSRGAFTARALAGFIGKYGMIEKGEMRLLPQLWKLYEKRKSGKEATGKLKKALDAGIADVSIKCVGVWDTVGALGIPAEVFGPANRKRFQFLDASLGKNVDVALHAVAIDEKRGPFVPTLWEKKARDTQLVEQVWFPGVHSNVGGSYLDARLSDTALDWMIKRLKATTELSFDNDYINDKDRVDSNALGKLYDSRGNLYIFSRVSPKIRLIGQNKVSASWLRRLTMRTTERDNGGPYLNEMIHQSAIDRFGREAPVENGKEVYEPANLAAVLADDAIHKLPIVGHDGNYDGNRHPPHP